MSQETSWKWGHFLVALLALMAGGQAIHWLITPPSASASYGRWWAVVAQAVLGIGVGIWFLLKARNLKRANEGS